MFFKPLHKINIGQWLILKMWSYMYIILLLTTLYVNLVHICNHENWKSREAP